MNRPARIIGAIGAAFVMVTPAASATDTKSLRLITGAELGKLVVGSAMGYGNPSDNSAFSVFRANYHYKFYGSEPWGAEGDYRVDADQVCVDTATPWCFKVFLGHRGQYFILMSGQGPDSYQLVQFNHLQPGERL